jgi:anaerobic magnesium-protoporphyrin IX monomethyl ester cyclase
MRKPSVLLLTIPYYYLQNYNGNVLPPVHLLYLGAYLREKGYEVELFDVLVELGVPKTFAEVERFKVTLAEEIAVRGKGFDVVGLSCYTSSQYLPALDVAAVCKTVWPESRIVVGGYHASALPNDFFFAGSPFDHVVKGEGEVPMLRLLTEMEQGRETPPVLVDPPVLDVNELPDLDFSMVEDWSRYSHFYDYLSRGCPFPCTFCMEAVKPERSWRAVTPERAVQKIAKAVEHLGDSLLSKGKLYMINDAIFGPNKGWKNDVLRAIGTAKFDLVFFTSPRIDTHDEEGLELLKEANFRIDFPIESGSHAILRDYMRKTSVPERYLAKAETMMAYSRDIGLPHHTHWIFGHPGETPETVRESFDFMRKVHGDNEYGMTEIFFFKLYPGTWLYDNWKTVQEQWGAEMLIPDYWRLHEDLDASRYHITPSRELSRVELLSVVDDTILPWGAASNQTAFPHHDVCCGNMREENAPWIL